jgi:hypothetical protein
MSSRHHWLTCLSGLLQVALRDRLEEMVDSQMAPAVTAGARILYVATYGDSSVGGSVIAAKVDSW